jgi:hypothetical protein
MSKQMGGRRQEEERGLTERKHRKRKTHSVVLVRRKEKHSISQPSPYEHIGDNPTHQMRRVERYSAHPIQRNKVPSQRARNSTDMDCTRCSRVAEVRERQVEEVDHKEEFSEPEVAAHPEVDEAEEKQVGRDIVAADVGGGS